MPFFAISRKACGASAFRERAGFVVVVLLLLSMRHASLGAFLVEGLSGRDALSASPMPLERRWKNKIPSARSLETYMVIKCCSAIESAKRMQNVILAAMA